MEHIISGDALQAFIGYDTYSQQVILSFRGTSNTANQLSDLGKISKATIEDTTATTTTHTDYELVEYDYPPTRKKYYSLHYGIYEAYKDLNKFGLSRHMQTVFTKYPFAQILLTGHSLGGALASIAGLELKASPQWNVTQNVSVITFGSPKWCDDNLAEYFSEAMDESFRIVNQNDVIPSFPPKFFGFHHVGVEIRYTSNDPLTWNVCTEPYGNYDGCYYGLSVSDHLMYFGKDLEQTEDEHVGITGMFSYNNWTEIGFSSTELMELETTKSEEEKESAHGVAFEVLQLRIEVLMGCVVGLMIVLFCVCWLRRRVNTKKVKSEKEYHPMDAEL